MADNLAKIVTILESNVNNNETREDDQRTPVSSNTPIGSIASNYRTTRIPNNKDDDFFLKGPTFSERMTRYFMVIVYLCGLCSIGFVLSVYHIFFWDSRMPPVHKSMIMKKPVYITKP